jgi:uncharacterized protein
MEAHRVRFRSDGLELVGDLYLAADGEPPYPAVALTGPFSSVKEQVTGTYASQFARRGFAALAFDHRGWGESEGEPRNHEAAGAKVSDMRDAVSHLATRAEVDADRLAVCGICLGAVYAAQFAAFDPRVRALALIGGSYNEPTALRERFGADAYERLMQEFAAISQRQHETGELEYWPATNRDGMPAGMPGPEPAQYYETKRGARPQWENRCTALSVMEELTISIGPALAMLSPTPVLMVHGTGDQAVPPQDARAAYEAVGEPRRLVWLEAANHVDIYDKSDLVQPASDAAAEWFERHLGGAQPHQASPAGVTEPVE